MPLETPLLLIHPTRQVSIDASTLGVAEDAWDALPWASAFDAMAALEAGAVANPDERRQVGHYWLRDAERAPTPALTQAIRDTAHAVVAFAEAVRGGEARTPEGAAFTDVLHVGIGGSALGPQLLVDALGPSALRLHFVDNLDPDGLARTLAAIGARIATTLVVVVSKSGGTPETMLSAGLVFDHMRAHQVDPAPRSVAVTGEGSRLDQRAQTEGWRARFPMWDWVGGRTSVTAAVGLIPAALAGIDVDALLEGARAMDAWTRQPAWRANPAALLAGGWHAVGQGRGDRAMVVLPYSDRLLLLSRYLQQLVMESLGKRHNLQGQEVYQGLVVYGNKGSTDQHAFVQQLRDGRNDFFATLIQVLEDGAGSTQAVDDGANAGDVLQGFLLGTRQALAEDGRPSLLITVERVDAWTLGALIALFERAVGLYASLVGINAYHQPGVEAGKLAARSVVELQRRVRGALTDQPQGAASLAERLEADANQVFHLCQRLVATGRAAREGQGITAGFRIP